MEIEEETFPAVSSFEEESQEETEVSRGTLFVDVRGAVAKPAFTNFRKKVGFFRRWKRPAGLLSRSPGTAGKPGGRADGRAAGLHSL